MGARLGLLGEDRILEVFEAAIELGLYKSELRDALVAGLPNAVAAALPTRALPNVQLFSTLQTLNRMGRSGGVLPFATWLERGLLLTKVHPRSSTLADALAEVQRVATEEDAGPFEPWRGDDADLPTLASPPRMRGLFVGREEELDRLYELLVGGAKANTAALAGIRGIGGVGKTALAMRFAERYEAHFPGGILWGDLGTNSDDGERGANVTPEEALRSVLRKWLAELGQPSQLGELETLTGVVRRLVAERARKLGPCLVILDNVDSEVTLNHLRDALSDASILVTTRQRDLAASNGMVTLDLSGLTRDASLSYLRAALPNDARVERDEMARVLDTIEDHPLALRLVATMLKNSSSATAADVLERLLQDGGQEATGHRTGALVHVPQGLRDCFRLSISALARPGLRSFLIATASQSPTSWPLEVVDYTSGVSNLKRSRQFVQELCDEGLVEPVGDNRYRIHRLLRDYLRAEHGDDGFGFFPPTWEPTTLAWFLMRLRPTVSAGQAVYDHRQEAWHLRFARMHRGDPAALRREWDGVLAGISRRAAAERSAAAGEGLLAFKEYLRGTDLTGIKLKKTILDGVSLEGAKLDGADLASDGLRVLGPVRRLWITLTLSGLFAAAWLFDGWRAALPWFATAWLPASAQLLIEGGRLFDRAGVAARFVLEFMLVTAGFMLASVPSVAAWFKQKPYPDKPNPFVLGFESVAVAFPLIFAVVLLAAIPFFLSHRGSRDVGAGGVEGRLLRGSLYAIATAALLPVFVLSMEKLGAFGDSPEPLFIRCIKLSTLVVLAFVGGLWLSPETGVRLWSVKATYLRRAHLRETSFLKASLAWVRFDRSEMEGAVLAGADLKHARFEGARLDRADFSGADLRFTDFTGATLEGARFDGAIHDRTTIWPEGFTAPKEDLDAA